MKKNSSKYAKMFSALVVLSAGTVSCSDSFLTEKPYSNYDATNVDPTTIENRLIGLHLNFAQLWGWSSQQGFLSCWQVGTDVASPGATQGVENGFYAYADLNPENAGVAYLWQKCYEFINNANSIIAATDEGQAAQESEARFFRAYAYNMLVTLWGGVPLLAEAVSVPTFNYARASVAAVDELIDQDLTFAMANLPNVGEAVSESRINKDMARQLAAEAFLRIGMRDPSYFQRAEQAATAVIDGPYSLIQARYGDYLNQGGDYFRDMFRQGNLRRSEGNTEAIWTFELAFNREVNGGTIDNPQHRRVWQPGYHGYDGMVNADSLGGRGIGRLRLSNFMKYTVWRGLEGDIRNSNYNIRRTTNYNRPGFSAQIGLDADGFRVAAGAGVQNITIRTGDPLIPFRADSLDRWYPYPTKWGGYDPLDDFGYALVRDWPLMRLGETHLLRAEARLRQGNATGAAQDVNALRDRAFKEARQSSGRTDLGRVTAASIDIDFILDERARELIAEENRRMTLVRTGKLADRILVNGDAVPAAPANKVITGFQRYHVLLPIPLSEIQLNNKEGNPLEQNTGYN